MILIPGGRQHCDVRCKCQTSHKHVLNRRAFLIRFDVYIRVYAAIYICIEARKLKVEQFKSV